MEKTTSTKITSLTFGILVICFAAGFYIFAWTGAPPSPPQDNAPAPINVGPGNQTKQGNLTIGTATIKGDGSISTNLNSDKVDNLHSADLLAQSGGGGSLITYGYCSAVSTCNPGQDAPACPAGWTEVYGGYAVTTVSLGSSFLSMFSSGMCVPTINWSYEGTFGSAYYWSVGPVKSDGDAVGGGWFPRDYGAGNFGGWKHAFTCRVCVK